MKVLFSLAAFLVTLLGIGWLGFPETMLQLWAVKGDPITIYMSRRYGGLLFGYAVILWLGREAPPSAAKSAILAGGVVVTTVMTALSLLGVLTGTIGPGAWGAVVIEAVLAAGFTYYYATGR